MKNRHKCQIFTPKDKVNLLLDSINYKNDLYGKRVLENSCGDGSILAEIIYRYIQDCIKNNFSLAKIKKGLETDIYGFEVDEKRFNDCLNNLNKITQKYYIRDVAWNIYNKDFLKESREVKFSFIIGNPPYAKYSELDEETRLFVKSKFKVCKKGKFDYCYAFIEAGLNYLNTKGKMAYLIPSSIFKNVFAEELRRFMHPYIKEIKDFKTKKVFKNILVSSSIIVFDKNYIDDYIKYYNAEEKVTLKIPKDQLKNKWMFRISEKNKEESTNKVKFGDYFTASISIATLLNKAFVLRNFKEGSQNFQIETDIVKKAVSPRSQRYNFDESIIFPYWYANGTLKRYTQNEFENKFPNAVKYLKKFSDALSKRDVDSSSKWFEYGRSQALARLNRKKLLISTVVTKNIKVYELKKDCIPYSGIFITSNNGTPLNKAKQILESEDFLEYVKNIGIQANGASIRITPKDINQYEFDKGEI